MGQVHCKDDGILCHEPHILHICTSVWYANWPMWERKEIIQHGFSGPLHCPPVILHGGPSPLFFPSVFSLLSALSLFQKHHTIWANLQSHSGAIFICSSSSSRGLWFTPYNNGWIQRQHLGDHPLRGSHKCFNSGHIIMNLTKFKVMPSMDAACHGPSPMARS
jgi:hypothetical protein